MEELIAQGLFEKCYELVDVHKYVPSIDDLMCCLKYITMRNCSEMMKLYEFILPFLQEHPTIDLILKNLESCNISNTFSYVISYVIHLSNITDNESLKKINHFLQIKFDYTTFHMSNNFHEGWVEGFDDIKIQCSCVTLDSCFKSFAISHGFYKEINQTEFFNFKAKYNYGQ
mgnify:CR=1 FL=1